MAVCARVQSRCDQGRLRDWILSPGCVEVSALRRLCWTRIQSTQSASPRRCRRTSNPSCPPLRRGPENSILQSSTDAVARRAARVMGCTPANRSCSGVQTATAESRRGCYVVWTLRDWACNCSRRPDLRRAPGAYAGALDCGGGDCTFRSCHSERGKGDAAERSRGM